MIVRKAIFLGVLLIAGAVMATPEEDHADAIRKLGVTNIVVKNPGYFFYGGEYIQPPYTVTREGDFLKINGRYIRFFCKWPQPKRRKWHVTNKKPEVPGSITEKSDAFDPVVQSYMDDCFDYWLTTHETNDCSFGASAVVEGMRKLPCVKDAYVDNDGCPTIVWREGVNNETSCDYSFMASNPSWWNPPPIDPKSFAIGGDAAAVELAEWVSGRNYLFWPLKNGGPRIKDCDLEPKFDKILRNIDRYTTAETLSAACGEPWSIEMCRDILKHKDSFDAALRGRIKSRVDEIEAAKRAEREKDAAARKRAAEERARRRAAELAPTVEWTPEAARKGGMRFYAYYKSICYSGEPFVPYAFWPRSTQPGDKEKWRYRLRENSVQAFEGFMCGDEAQNTRTLEDVAAGCRRVKDGKYMVIRPDTIQWCISCDFPVAKDNPAAYARIPMLVSSNLNPAFLLREWDGRKDADKVLPLGKESGAEKSLFGDACVVMVFNDGSAETIPAKELTYSRIYRRAFKGPDAFGYLTVRGFVEPGGMRKDAEKESRRTR